MLINSQLVHKCIVEAGEIAKGYFEKGCDWELKDNNTVVTEADRIVQAFLVDKIRAYYPGHAIIAEEEGVRTNGEEYSWAVDPIDGTSAFVWGIPTWCISIGVLKNGEPYFGMVYLPMTKETYFADGQGGSYWNRQRNKVNDKIEEDALLCVSPRTFQQYTVSFPKYVGSFGSGIYHNCLVSRGRAIGAISLEPNIWDLAAVYPMLEAAGGTVRYLSGKPFQLHELIDNPSPEPLVAAHPSIIDQVFGYFKRK